MLRWATINNPCDTVEAVIGEYDERKKVREAEERAS